MRRKRKEKIEIFKVFVIFLALTITFVSQAQQTPHQLKLYFDELAAQTKTHQKLWDINLYGPILLIDVETKHVFANMPDSAGVLQSEDEIYTGTLPDNWVTANTSVRWNGMLWATVMLPLPENKYTRTGLMAHELFHSAQSALGFTAYNASNNHLDDKNGRVYLRLELEALKSALLANSTSEKKNHLNSAFLFREYRRSFYPGSDSLENQLELNEGIAEFTGESISGRPDAEKPEHFIASINQFLNNPSFVRSFAYHTIPAYGYLLSREKGDWNKKINAHTDLTAFFINAFKLNPKKLRVTVSERASQYNAKIIIAEETAREERINQLKLEYTAKLVEQSHLEIGLEQMQIGFDPRNIMPLGEYGTVYPTMNITDKWGVLTVTGGGALMSPMWNKVSVSLPVTQLENRIISGDRWTLELVDGYTVILDQKSGNYVIVKI